jgi:hypothetical protein
MVMELPEIISIDYLLRRVNRNDQEAIQLLREAHSQLEQILKEEVGVSRFESDVPSSNPNFPMPWRCFLCHYGTISCAIHAGSDGVSHR